jgi:FixJ family two-component response regulator
MDAAATIFVVDDDASVRNTVGAFLKSVGFQVQAFRSAEAFQNASRPEVLSCLVLEVKLPGMDGLDLQEWLCRTGVKIPIVFLTAHGDISMTSRAMKAGAVDFLTKPLKTEDLLEAVHRGLGVDGKRRKNERELAALRSRFGMLTSREREVLESVAAGMTNKEVAAKLGVSEVTVKMHRGQVTRKMKADSLPDLVRMADKIYRRSRE